MLFQAKLPGVFLKVLRAKEHLDSVSLIDRRFANTECEVVFKEDPEQDLGWLELQLPKPPSELSVIVGECLHHLRSTLDHLIWQLVLSNRPHQPTSRNMFPICSSSALFAKQLSGGRLAGVSPRVQCAVESLQPFSDPEHPLLTLDALNNTDKHRTLNFTVAVASDLDLYWTRDGEVITRTFLGNEDVYDGARLIGFRLSDPPMKLNRQIRVVGRANGFVALQDSPLPGEEAVGVVRVLDAIWEHVANEVVPALEPFIH